jgi:hypothetical protein
MHRAQRGIVGFRAAVAVEKAIELRRRERREQRRQFDHRRMRRLEEGVVVGQFLHLLQRGVGEFASSIAHVHTPQSRHAIDDAIALRVPEIDALGLYDHAAARSIEGAHIGERMQMMRGIERAVMCRRIDSIVHVVVSFKRAAADACVPTN